MSLIQKIARYPTVVARCWWNGGVAAVVQDAVATLRSHLGIDQLDEKTRVLERKMQTVLPVTSTWVLSNWVEHACLETTPLVSVIMPTYNRSRVLSRAIESVQAQLYPHWELVVTDDGSTDETPALLDKLRSNLGADRLKVIRTSRGGVCTARNRALASANGAFIVYLDDDNVMHPLWIKAVVWAFSQRPEVDVLYGGLVVDDMRRMNGGGSGDLPAYYLYPFDRNRLLKDNLADIGQIAHRRGLAEARFDETLGGLGDWDLLLRLTRDKEPLVIPVLACLYSTSATDRLSVDPSFQVEAAHVRQRAR
jgi:hypothetical protein